MKKILLISSFLSFCFGVLVTLYFNPSEKNQNLKSEISIKNKKLAQETRPAVSVSSSLSDVSSTHAIDPELDLQHSSKDLIGKEKGSESIKKSDYFALAAMMDSFSENVSIEVDKKFVRADLGKKKYKDKRDFILGKVDSFKESKRLWFKMTLNVESTQEKIFSYYNYYPCDVNASTAPVKKDLVDNICYATHDYFFIQGKWFYSGTAGMLKYEQWREDIPYVMPYLSSMPEYSRITKRIKILFPHPDLDGKVHFLKYENEKFIWEEGPDVEWVPTTEKEEQKFNADINFRNQFLDQ